jgi:hypothetical protein
LKLIDLYQRRQRCTGFEEGRHRGCHGCAWHGRCKRSSGHGAAG